METIVIWNLSTFCRFYGKIIPYYPHSNENEKFNSFHTYTKNSNIEELKVIFEQNLSPMSFMDLVINTNYLYVMGHGNTWINVDGRCSYESYTLYTENGIKSYLHNIFTEEKYNKVLHELALLNQVKIHLNK